MEILTILLSTLLVLISPVSVAIDKVSENALRSQFERVEQLQVRVDNAPTHQLLKGKVERIRVAGRGLWLRPEIRIAALDLETDPIDIELGELKAKLKNRDLSFLEKPLQTGVRLVLTEEDINRALMSPAVTNRLRNLTVRSLPSIAAAQVERYELLNPQVEFLEDNRLRFKIDLQERNTTTPFNLALLAETGLKTADGRKLQLVEPRLEVNGKPVPDLLLNLIVEGFNRRFDLQNLEASGITARLLQLKVNPEQLELAAFVRLEPPQ